MNLQTAIILPAEVLGELFLGVSASFMIGWKCLLFPEISFKLSEYA